MAILFKKENGETVYKGLVNSEEKKKADELHKYLVTEIPALEKRLQERYAAGNVEFWYSFGKALREIVEKYAINTEERRYLWQAIANLAASKVSARKDRSGERVNYEYFYKLAEFPIAQIKKINWSEWSTFFDSVSIRREARSFEWFLSINSVEALNRKEMRMLMIAMNKSLEGKETWMYTDNELFDRFNAALTGVKYLISQEAKISREKRKKESKAASSKKRTQKGKRESKKNTEQKQKYFKEFFKLLDKSDPEPLAEVCAKAYESLALKI